MKKCLVVLISLIFVACNDSKYSEDIVGEWECISWIETSTGKDKCENNAYFNFREDLTYTSKVGAQDTQGTYKIADGIIYSQPEGKLEIAVEIHTLNNDTLSFIMSRSGQEEVLTMLKKR